MSRIGFETDLDKCIDAMADSIAGCKYALLKKQCSKYDCIYCNIGCRNLKLYNSFTEMDRLRIDNEVNKRVSLLMSAKFGSILSPIKKVTLILRYILSIVAVSISAIFIMRMLLGCVIVPKDNTATVQNVITSDCVSHPQVYAKIKDILNATSSLDVDMNNDGLVNCIDRAVLFKEEWDRTYPFYKYRCIIVRNRNDKWHHLFVQIDYLGLWCIEPNGDSNRFIMETYWGSTYKRANNIYNETDKWLSYNRR